jgi:hypothetical protein
MASLWLQDLLSKDVRRKLFIINNLAAVAEGDSDRFTQKLQIQMNHLLRGNDHLQRAFLFSVQILLPTLLLCAGSTKLPAKLRQGI